MRARLDDWLLMREAKRVADGYVAAARRELPHETRDAFWEGFAQAAYELTLGTLELAAEGVLSNVKVE